MHANASKSLHVTFTTRSGTCPPVHLNNMQLSREDHVKYLGLHLDRRLTWRQHIFAKRKQLGLTLTKMYWLFGRKPLLQNLALQNHPETDLDLRNPTLGYGFHIQIEILERFQLKALRLIVDAPWYVPNTIIRRDLNMPTVKEEICTYSSHYSHRLSAHPNDLILPLFEPPDHRRLRRFLPNDLPTRF
jgi:hypothetical protein